MFLDKSENDGRRRRRRRKKTAAHTGSKRATNGWPEMRRHGCNVIFLQDFTFRFSMKTFTAPRLSLFRPHMCISEVKRVRLPNSV